jgi:hypothetical protein
MGLHTDEWDALEELGVRLGMPVSAVVERMVTASMTRGDLCFEGASRQSSVYISPEAIEVLETKRSRCEKPKSLGAIVRAAVRQCLGAMAFDLDVMAKQGSYPGTIERRRARLRASRRRR